MTEEKFTNFDDRNKSMDSFDQATPSVKKWNTFQIVIENVSPEINNGLFAAKHIIGEKFWVEADIFKDSHDILGASLKFRPLCEKSWCEVPMEFWDNDRWRGYFIPTKLGRYEYTLGAWVDPVATWMRDMEKRCPAYPSVQGDLIEGLELLHCVEKKAKGETREKIHAFLKLLELSNGASDEVLRVIVDKHFRELLSKFVIKEKISPYDKKLQLVVDRKKAEFGAWYEMFPRSQGRVPNKSGTFEDCMKRLPDIKKMGFDVIYLTPLHPIGRTNRKGPNNTLTPHENSPGSTWAIGSEEGGHKAIHPELGTMDDFLEFVSAAKNLHIEIALDYAVQCSPDHPYVQAHPEWFYHLPDGRIRYAENPPKKYQDIYPINFYCSNWRELWEELKSIVIFWAEKGIRIFRVDNPHTKPLRFWKWLIEGVQKKYPDVIFLSEAFTRPKVMKYLAKCGFTQSYTYFTWRNQKWEIRQYLEELTQTDMKYYFRGNFFANTPDILTEILQKGGRPAFKMRLVLAATLSPSYGIYSGFELCENRAFRKGSEEYLHSEKYEHKVWDWNRLGHIKDFVAKINHIRNSNPALQQYSNLEFYDSKNDQILCYGKKSEDHSNIVVVVVNLDPFRTHDDMITLPVEEFGIKDSNQYEMQDLITGKVYPWKGQNNYVRLNPMEEPAHIFRLKS